ncbi:hypothetical protein EUTSA_v10017268mg [Eutrema salsugineum]|uniref:Uncharacterized protein n=1 Tax=Eutrema salsugineum TaxID=72664 RepID=V4M8U5_EUTSA|nr:uncharacterized protein DDB_G0271670 [Eutrema salsugineum]ESQ52764.1 hypothetical protein EUTSA_v10017268mg [Eutrema salsugineum]
MSERSEDDTNRVRSSKVIVKESSQVNSSSRIYYYGGASVPFLWETRPGTPKHSLFSESFRLPPLTPPPSYYSSSSSSSGNKLSKVRAKQTRFVKTLFNGKHHVSRPSFSWSSSTSSSSSSSSSSPRSKTENRPKKCYLSCSRSYVKDDDAEETIGSSSPTSTLCYKRGFSSSMGSMKRALCSVLSHGSSRKDLRLI